jgi:hypothetical protein
VHKYSTGKAHSAYDVGELGNVLPVYVSGVSFHLHGVPTQTRAPEGTVHTAIATVPAAAQHHSPRVLQGRHDDLFKDLRFDLAQICEASGRTAWFGE